MKTSNKTLWGIIGGIFLIVLVVAIVMRTHSPSGFTISFYHDQITGDGQIITKTRDLSKFNAIKISVVGKVVVKPGDHFQITIKNDKNLIPHISTTVEDGVLSVQSKDNAALHPSGNALFTITTNDLQRFVSSGVNQVTISQIDPKQFTLDLSGRGQASLSGKTKNLQMNISGRGDITANKLIAKHTNINISGAGNLTLNGKTKSFRTKISGAGQIAAKNFVTDNAKILISGMGHIKLYVRNSLSAKISGAGSITYYGHPKEIKQHVSGVGSITQGTAE